jgi:putative ABC transport system substrate-binding protein
VKRVNHGSMRRVLVGALCMLPFFAATAQDRPRVLVLKSSTFAAYNSVVAGFSADLRGEVEELTLPEGTGAVDKAVEGAQKRKPRLVLAIGPHAATAARRAFSDVPIIFTMVPYHERYGLEAPNITGIALTNDLSVELETLAAVSPQSRRVGILHDPRFSKALVSEAGKLAARQGLTVVGLEVDSAGKVDRVLAQARGKVDTLLMIADKTVASAEVVRKLIAFSLEARLPLVGLSASQVKEGAMLSLSPSYTAVGQQAGRLANRILHEKVDAGALAVAQPEVLDMAVNLGTAKRFGQTCDVALEIFKYAARRGYPIKVFE